VRHFSSANLMLQYVMQQLAADAAAIRPSGVAGKLAPSGDDLSNDWRLVALATVIAIYRGGCSRVK
jgi:hypothetical protein